MRAGIIHSETAGSNELNRVIAIKKAYIQVASSAETQEYETTCVVARHRIKQLYKKYGLKHRREVDEIKKSGKD